MSGPGSRLFCATCLTTAAALVLHVTAMAQVDRSSTLAVADTGPRGSDTSEAVPAEATSHPILVPFAGTYRLTMALGADTADFILRVGEQGVERSIAMPASRKRQKERPAPLRALIVPASLSTDSSTVPAVEVDSSVTLTGTITASASDTASPGQWWVTILAGDDTASDTPAARLSRLLRRVEAERTALAERCRMSAKDENRAAKRLDEPAPCDESSGLPFSRTASSGDGVLVFWPDGRARVEQRTQTEAGELTLWGSRIQP